MNKWLMIIDIEKCENCNNCFLACKDEHYQNDWKPYTLSQPLHGHRWMNILTREQGEFPYISVTYLPKPCFHCEDAACVRNTSKKEIYQRSDGIVVVDPEKARGKRNLVKACPQGAIWWNEENQTPQKCTLCAHLLDDGWKAPRCVQACPTGALTFKSLPEEELFSFIKANDLESFHKVMRGRSIVMYKNLSLYRKCFIAGSVATRKNGVEECVEGVTVELFKNGSLVDQKITDSFGEYRFSGLPEKRGKYQIRVIYQHKVTDEFDIELVESCFAKVSWI
ncbi:Pyrogallol hydroxytransferase small subunit [Desulfamplus magnetovallimortis]|uniref:Pyrogallol hydroxytransferase small subunit n=1 Tax=Desulfamplus magnetovallimortis TaxID=1246637 RepID=A0A1W1HGV2_9BACT|nr:4Fe-4S dicluster domain-containing protein [Desulfamplus magnetovallimortis]SLM31709.1 Pyrogallol hydroxytransferase small subunit [Desulfamplus magnetovallimortis]